MPAMHDDVWDGPPRRPWDTQDQRLQAVLGERDRAGNGGRGQISEELERRVRKVVAEHEHHASSRPAEGDWKPDEWDRKVHAVLDWRDRVADSVDGPVPAFGSPEWAAADEQTRAAAYARYERDVAAAQGKAISDRMARESAEWNARGAAIKPVSTEWRRRGYSRPPLKASARARRDADRARRAEAPKPWEDDYSASFPTAPVVPTQRQQSDTRECVQRATAAAARAAARSPAVTGPAPARTPAEDAAQPDVQV